MPADTPTDDFQTAAAEGRIHHEDGRLVVDPPADGQIPTPAETERDQALRQRASLSAALAAAIERGQTAEQERDQARTDRDEARAARDATRRLAITANAQIRQQLLTALDRDDDGSTPLADYITALVDERDQASTEMAAADRDLAHARRELEATRAELATADQLAAVLRQRITVTEERLRLAQTQPVAPVPATPAPEPDRAPVDQVTAAGMHASADAMRRYLAGRPSPHAEIAEAAQRLRDRMATAIETALNPCPDVSGCPGTVAGIAADAALTALAQMATAPSAQDSAGKRCPRETGGTDTTPEGDRIGGDDHSPQTAAEPDDTANPGWTALLRRAEWGGDDATDAVCDAYSLGRSDGYRQAAASTRSTTPAAPSPQDIPPEWMLVHLRRANIEAALDIADDELLDHPDTDPYRQAIRSAYRVGYAAAHGCEITVADEGDYIHIGDRSEPATPDSAGLDAASPPAMTMQQLDRARHDYDQAEDDEERADVIGDLLADWYAAWPNSAATDPHQPIAAEILRIVSHQPDPVSPVPAAASIDTYHWGRSWSPSAIEAACPCPKAPCGYVIHGQEADDCVEHDGRRTMRGGHTADHCPGHP